MVFRQSRSGSIIDVASDERPNVVTPLFIKTFRLRKHICWIVPAEAGDGEEF